MILSIHTQAILTILVAIYSVSAVSFVFLKSKNKKVNWVFLFLNASLVSWLVNQYFAFVPAFNDKSIFFARISILSGVYHASAMYLLTETLVKKELPPKKHLLFLFVSVALLTPLMLSKYVFKSVEFSGTNVKTNIGFGFSFFLLFITFYTTVAIRSLVLGIKKAAKEEVQALRIVLWGIILMTAGFLTTITIPVALFNSTYFVPLGGIYILLFLFFTAVAIVRYNLFEIKFVAVEVLVLMLNSFLFVQALFAESVSKKISGALVLIVALIISWYLIKSNRREMKKFEEETKMEMLEESNRQLQDLDRQKTEFLNIAAHQLRTPASVINNYVAMMKDGDYGQIPEQLNEVIDNIGTSNQWLIRLASEFLNIAHLEAGQTKYHFSKTNLITVVDSVYKELAARAKSKKLRLEWARPAGSIQVDADEEKIRQAIFNFAENAIKYSSNGTIVLSLAADRRGATVKVVDQGVGFTSVEAEDFFKKFRRGKNAHQIEVNTSTGLGLYICKMFVEGHNGRVWSKSAGPGQGSEFGLWIPLKNKN